MLTGKIASDNDIHALMAAIGRRARAAAAPLAIASPQAKHAALLAMAEAVEAGMASILEANAIDMQNGVKAGLSSAMLDRLIRNLSREQDQKAFAEWDAPAPTDDGAS